MVNPLKDKNISTEDLKKYVLEKNQEVETDYSNRVNGIKNSIGTGYKLAGYDNLRKFYDGDHWSYNKEDGTPIRVYNYCRTAVTNYTAFLSYDPPEIDIPPRDINDDFEVARTDVVERLVKKILDDNIFSITFSDACQNQSLLGDAFIYGPYVEYMKVGGALVPRIRFVNVKRPENIRILWSDENFEEMDGFIQHFRISVKKAEQVYSEQLKKRGISSLIYDEPDSYTNETGYQMVTLLHYWDSRYSLLMTKAGQVIDVSFHNWGFIPGLYVKNLNHPLKPTGISDIEDILDPQVEYNESVCATRGKINQAAVPHIFYAGEGEPIEYTAGQAQMIKLGVDDRVFPDPMGQSTAPFDQYTGGRKDDIHNLSMISDIFYGAGPSRASGRALSVLMQGINNVVKLKQMRWTNALKQLIANSLRLTEILYPKSRALIQGHYEADTFFPSVLIRDVNEELNKFNMKAQSLFTTQKHLGIPSPDEETQRMKKEWNDQDLMVEISRNPALKLQIQQMVAEKIAQAAQGQQRPMLSEEENVEEEGQPAATEGTLQSPTSPEGAIALEEHRKPRA